MMLEFLGAAFSIILALVIFGLMLAVAVYGFRESEKAVNDHDSKKHAGDGARAEAGSAQAP